MKISYLVSLAASGLSVILAITVLVVGKMNQGLQAELQKDQGELQKQQQTIEKANQLNSQIGPKILQDMAEVSLKNEKMKSLLAHYGYSVQPPPEAKDAKGGTKPAPASPAPAAGGEIPALR